MRLDQRLFYLLVIFLPSGLSYHFWPAWASVLGRRVDYLSPTIYLTDLLATFVLGSYIFHLKPNINFRKIIILGVFAIFAALNIFFAANRPVAVYKWIKVFEFLGLGWYIFKSKPNLVLLTYCLSLGVLYSSLIAIGQFIFQRSLGSVFWWLGERTFAGATPGIAQFNLCFLLDSNCRLLLRPYATFPHPNVLGGFLAVTLPLIFALLTKTKIIFFKFFLLTTSILGITALVLTFSRSALSLGLIGIFFSLFPQKYLIARLMLVFAVIGILLVLFRMNFQEESLLVRGQLNQAAIKIWQQSPVFGVGLGNFLVRLPEFLPQRQIYFLQPVHNIYLFVLSETGIVGLGLFGGMIYKIVKRRKLLILSVPLFILLLLGLVDHYPLTLQQGQLLLVILIGQALVSIQKHRS